MKHIILIIIIAAAAIGIIIWFQAKPIEESLISVTNGTNLATEAQEIDIGSADNGFQEIDAGISQL
ncbi:hypothetical protein A2Z10_01465 [Candidatus Azambacteria bacterium RBG_16_47_10]|uniref:Uncharacterized protein n=1 Tax=Candidatus Azambacteria bacterium RBG_16_47_10 TaxID=1797292 RepID=A0A1F5AY86_9BACT|nr:MAG: hypothetical protein A2Z10_01465 [Candidatus Azambacteria bacterium RBG_16_47_10]